MIVGEGLCYPPIDLLYVGALLERDGHQVSVIDAEATSMPPEQVMEQLGDRPADLVLMATSSATIELDLQLADRIKARLPRSFVFITGSQGSKVPDMALHNSTIDAVVRGEPELTVRDAVAALARGEDPLQVPGLSVQRDGALLHNPERSPLQGESLDDLPVPARGLVDGAPYRIPTMEGPITTVVSSRGCPINCTYCGYVVAQGVSWRGRSARNVFDELQHVVDLGIRNVVFRDPLFAHDRQRVVDLCTLMVEADLGLKWQCETAIKTVDAELLELMSRAGCMSISFGVESGNEVLQRKYSRGKIKDHAHAKAVIDACRRYGIGTRCFFMIGFPEETPDMVRQTIDLAVYLNPDTVQFTAVTPYPDTKLYDESMADRGGRDFDYSKFSGLTPVGVAKAMSADEVLRNIRRAYRRFYLRPSRIWREVKRPQLLLQRMRRYVGLMQTVGLDA